jgi:type II secretory ATPase GspE/PulE/Tfp pilus assembly ATPase PilB-like protein
MIASPPVSDKHRGPPRAASPEVYTARRIRGKETLTPQGAFLWEKLENTGLSREELQTALDTFREKVADDPFSKVIVDLGYSTEQVMAKWIAEFMKATLVGSAFLANPQHEVTTLLEPSVASLRGAIPLRREGGLLIVAIYDPEVPQFAQVRHALGGQPTKYVVATRSDIIQAIDDAYTEKVSADTEDDFAALIEALFREMATTPGASDLHFCPSEKNVEIKYRVDGLLQTRKSVDASRAKRLLSALKLSAARLEDGKTMVSAGYRGGLEVSKQHIPQDANAIRRYGAKRFALRYSILPSIDGESAVIRFLDQDVQVGDLASLGMLSDHVQFYKQIIRVPNGLIVNCGPTGHGKSTTLAATVQYMDTRTKRVLSVEDPVEYRLRGVTQIQVYPNLEEMTFAAIAKAIVRHNPNTIILGEMRDSISAGFGVGMSNTGHLVFSTAHSNDACSGWGRILNLGVDPFILAGATRLMLAQRLVRRLCEKCRKPHSNPAPIKKEWLGLIEIAHAAGMFPNGISFCEAGGGCKECRGTGFRGRVSIVEMRVPRPEVAAMIVTGSKDFSAAAAEQIYINDFKSGNLLCRTLLQDGIIKVARGETSYEEVIIATKIVV